MKSAAQGALSIVDERASGENREQLMNAVRDLRVEVAKRIVGQTDVIDEVLMAMLAGGHALLIGVPGLAKTLLISSLAEAMSLEFRRIQFTPDLVPSDITGTELLEEDQATKHRTFRFVRGPVFANIILADEINRAPPRTQAALLEAMQERHVTVSGDTMPLPKPFFVLATQNPIEQEGTYPLPEAQLDRFLFAIKVGYPKVAEEISIISETTGRKVVNIKAVCSGEDALALQAAARDVMVSQPVLEYVAAVVRATRPSEPDLPPSVRKYVRWGAGPRAGQALVLGAKAWALLHGRLAITPDDIKRVMYPVMRHRVLPNFAAEAEGVTPEDLIKEIVAHVPLPRSDIRI